MKKLFAVCICASLSFCLSGCTLGTVLEQFTSTGDTSVQETPVPSDNTVSEIKDRVYMDEISGTLQDFTGSQLILTSQDVSYVFNVSNATLECEGGMITGDEISVIYEGQLSNTDTSTVKALKVVDEFHKKNKLKNHTTRGKVMALTPNTITIKNKKGITTTYPITGTRQYYQNGIKSGDWVYIKYKGTLPDNSQDTSQAVNASHLKVLSISDLKKLKIPDPTPVPTQKPDDGSDEDITEKGQQFLATVQGVNLNILQIIPAGTDTLLNLDMSSVPVWFKGGIAPGSHVNITYKGDFQTDTLEGIQILAVTGEDPDNISDKHLSFTVTGTITGNTANTITLQTDDGAIDTFRVESAENYADQALEYGSYVRIIFHPSRSKSSNIYTAVQIHDA